MKDDRARQQAQAQLAPTLAGLWQQVLEHPEATGPVDALIGHPQAAQLVQALPPQDLFWLIKHRGLADATELVALCSPEQFLTFVDLDGFRQELPAIGAIAPWLQALFSGNPEDLPDKLEVLDIELQALILRGLVRIHPVDPEEELPTLPNLFHITADRSFVLELLEPALAELAEQLVRHKEEQLGPLGFSSFLSSVIYELPSSLEEEAARWRRGRLADLGFPPHDESLVLYLPLPAGEMQRMAGPVSRAGQEEETDLPRWLVHREAGSKLARATALLDASLRPRVEQDIVFLINTLMVAGDVDPGDQEATRAILARARGYLEIALELLGGADAERAASLLQHFSVRHLFRFTATGLFGLRVRALRLAPGAARFSLVEQAWLAALSRLPPRLPDLGEFHSREQLAQAEAELSQLEDMEQALRHDPVLAGLPRSSSALAAFGTALVRKVLGLAAARPVREADAREFLRRAFRGGRLVEEVRQLAGQWLAGALPDRQRGRLVADRWCAELEEELGGLDPETPLDPRLVGLLLAEQGASGAAGGASGEGGGEG